MYIFIVNPTAGNGGAKKAYDKIKKSREFKQVESRCFFTEYIGHAEQIASQLDTISGETRCVIVIGGDGTLHEVMNGLQKLAYPVSFIPVGSGNDFARGCRITGSPTEIFRCVITEQNKIPYWLGDYQGDEESKRKLVNSIGFGFDAKIAKTVNDSIYKKVLNKLYLGKISYVIALVQVLFHFKPMSIDIIADDKWRTLKSCWMVTIANHPYYGGGMKIIPKATIQAEVFPVLIIHSISKLKVLGLFLTVFTGRHVNFKEVEQFEAERLEISSDDYIPYQVDGQTSKCFSCVITKQKDAIKVIGA